jgi:hypothetical protein
MVQTLKPVAQDLINIALLDSDKDVVRFASILKNYLQSGFVDLNGFFDDDVLSTVAGIELKDLPELYCYYSNRLIGKVVMELSIMDFFIDDIE